MSQPSSARPPGGRVIRSAFQPAPVLGNAHLQTLAPQLRPRPRLDLSVERLDTPDGDFIDIAWAGDRQGSGPIALLLHGLGGGFDSKYLRGLAAGLVRAGWRCVVLQFRGGGAEANRLPRCYHQGDTGDLRWLWHRLRAAEPECFIAAVGWSMGGNILLRALAEEGVEAPIQQACAVSVPFSLQACAEHLDRGFARVYQRHLLKELKALVQRKRATGSIGERVDLYRALAAANFVDFDNAFTAPLNGFADARDYYQRCASAAILDRVRTPTHIIQARNDPFMPSSVMPQASQLSAAITLEIADSGGHVGFLGRHGAGATDWWLESRLLQCLQSARAGLAIPD